MSYPLEEYKSRTNTRVTFYKLTHNLFVMVSGLIEMLSFGSLQNYKVPGNKDNAQFIYSMENFVANS